jgi:hypothetical protein
MFRYASLRATGGVHSKNRLRRVQGNYSPPNDAELSRNSIIVSFPINLSKSFLELILAPEIDIKTSPGWIGFVKLLFLGKVFTDLIVKSSLLSENSSTADVDSPSSDLK